MISSGRKTLPNTQSADVAPGDVSDEAHAVAKGTFEEALGHGVEPTLNLLRGEMCVPGHLNCCGPALEQNNDQRWVPLGFPALSRYLNAFVERYNQDPSYDCPSHDLVESITEFHDFAT
jgi:hypothetical protein